MKGLRRLKQPQIEYIGRGPRVVALSAASALYFFGFDSENYEAVDVGPPADPHRWKPEARVYECRKKQSKMN
jgi:hypothetical protein